jgi:hypothetical protein
VDHQENTVDLIVNAATGIVSVVLPGVPSGPIANVMHPVDYQENTVDLIVNVVMVIV